MSDARTKRDEAYAVFLAENPGLDTLADADSFCQGWEAGRLYAAEQAAALRSEAEKAKKNADRWFFLASQRLVKIEWLRAWVRQNETGIGRLDGDEMCLSCRRHVRGSLSVGHDAECEWVALLAPTKEKVE